MVQTSTECEFDAFTFQATRAGSRPESLKNLISIKKVFDFSLISLQHEFVSALSSWVPDPPHTTFEDPYPHQNDPDPQWKDPADALDPQLQSSTSEGPLFG